MTGQNRMSDSPNSDPRVELAHNRTTLAKFRTALALDRTTLAWIRTTLTMGTFGLGMIGFFRSLSDRSQTPEAARLHHAAIRFGELLVINGHRGNRARGRVSLEHSAPHGARRVA